MYTRITKVVGHKYLQLVEPFETTAAKCACVFIEDQKMDLPMQTCQKQTSVCSGTLIHASNLLLPLGFGLPISWPHIRTVSQVFNCRNNREQIHIAPHGFCLENYAPR